MHQHDHAASTTPAALDPALLTLPELVGQDYSSYDAEAHDVWRILYDRRMATLRDTGSAVFPQRRRTESDSLQTACLTLSM